jgi:cell division FtsZ-interacting protein ZapD
VENYIIYEQPLNERIRNFLRLEHLFQQAFYTLRGYSVWDSRATITGLIDILDILSRSDLKTELLKELERHQAALAKLKDIPGVDREQLESILAQLTVPKMSSMMFRDNWGKVCENMNCWPVYVNAARWPAEAAILICRPTITGYNNHLKIASIFLKTGLKN